MYSSTRTEYEDNEGRKSAQSRAKNGTNSIPYQPPEENVPADQPLIWLNVFGIAMLHAASIYIFLIKYNQAKFWTWVFRTYLSDCQLVVYHILRRQVLLIAIELRNKKSLFYKITYCFWKLNKKYASDVAIYLRRCALLANL